MTKEGEIKRAEGKKEEWSKTKKKRIDRRKKLANKKQRRTMRGDI